MTTLNVTGKIEISYTLHGKQINAKHYKLNESYLVYDDTTFLLLAPRDLGYIACNYSKHMTYITLLTVHY